MSLFNEKKPFLETNAWQKSNLNSLRYNTSQAGSALPLIYGTTRQQVNLIALGDYRGPQGKKGKVGPLPLTGTHTSSTGKGGGGGGGGKKAAGGKKSGHYSVDVDFAICQGPVDIGPQNQVWASPGVAYFQSVGLNLYTGTDGQAADPVFAGLGDVVGYSGTCHVTGTPMDLGNSPVLPNISFEVTGFEVGTCGTALPKDANPANVVVDFLTNARYGAGWPTANLDPDIATPNTNNYGDYCQAALLGVSPALQTQSDAATWVAELARLTNTAIVWSGSTLKFIPFGDLALDSNGATWEPNLTPLYSFNDDHFLPWSSHVDRLDSQLGEDDPVIITRSNPSDATNWMSMEYLDRENKYNKTVVPQFDQGSIDLYGLRTEQAINGNCFCAKDTAERSLRLLLQRAVYVRNTFRFQVGWQYSLLEPMDLVLLTDSRLGLSEQAVRITAIEENENGDLIIDAEEVKTDLASPSAITPAPLSYSITVTHMGQFFSVANSPGGTLNDDVVGSSPLQFYISGFIITGSGSWTLSFTGQCGTPSSGTGEYTIAIQQDGVIIKTETVLFPAGPDLADISISDSGHFTGINSLFHIRGWYTPGVGDGANGTAIGSATMTFTPDA